MNDKLLVSVIINNYNYERFLTQAIDSALNQTYPHVEVIVVDDGSTDASRDILFGYGKQVIAVFKENGGQASALNEAFKISHGEIVCFLDSDDLFLPNKVEKVVQLFSQVGHSDIILSNLFEAVDEKNDSLEINVVKDLLFAPGEWRYLKELRGDQKFFNGDLYHVSRPRSVVDFAEKYRFIPYLGTPTSAFSITRNLARKIFPLPINIKISADVFIVNSASILGEVYSTEYILSQYRIHGNNNWFGKYSSEDWTAHESLFKELDIFLNSKLSLIGRKGVFCFMKSMVAKSYYRVYFQENCGGHLFQLSLQVIQWHFNLTTFHFFVKTFSLAVYYRLMARLMLVSGN